MTNALSNGDPAQTWRHRAPRRHVPRHAAATSSHHSIQGTILISETNGNLHRAVITRTNINQTPPPPPYGHTNAEPAESPASQPRATPSHRHHAFTHNNISGIGLPHQLPIWYTHLHKRGMQSTSQLLHTRPAHTPPFRHTQHRITPSARKKQKITKIRENANTSAFHESQRNSNLFY